MMIYTQIVEEGELKGSVNNPEPDLADTLKATKNGIAALEQEISILYIMLKSIFPFSNHWGNGLVPYTIDAAFTSSERAVIAQGITHVEENSCLRYS